MSEALLTVQPLRVVGTPNPAINIICRASVTMPTARIGYPAADRPKPIVHVKVDAIQKAVAAFYGLSQTELISERRAIYIARPRQVAMWLTKQLTTRSLPDIGRRFGGRDHTTVLHAIRRIEQLKAENLAIGTACDALIEQLGGVPA